MDLWNGPLIGITPRVDRRYGDNLLTKSRRLSGVRARAKTSNEPAKISGRDLNVTGFTQVLRAKGLYHWRTRFFFFGNYASTQCVHVYAYLMRWEKKSKQARLYIYISLDFYVYRTARYTMALHDGNYVLQRDPFLFTMYAIKRKLR